jgi:hypothetical protein
MDGPKPKGTGMASHPPMSFQHLSTGQQYIVVKAFADYDHAVHPVGETWRFLRHSFLPYEDGLSLFVSRDGQSERHIRLQWRQDAQGEIIDHLETYLVELQAL